jgi:carbonic anhydrase
MRRTQSTPIDFSGEMLDKDYVALNLDYKLDSILDITNNGHTVQVNIPWGKLITTGKNTIWFSFTFIRIASTALMENIFL